MVDWLEKNQQETDLETVVSMKHSDKVLVVLEKSRKGNSIKTNNCHYKRRRFSLQRVLQLSRLPN